MLELEEDFIFRMIRKIIVRILLRREISTIRRSMELGGMQTCKRRRYR